mgnify:CR=1 FL=1
MKSCDRARPHGVDGLAEKSAFERLPQRAAASRPRSRRSPLVDDALDLRSVEAARDVEPSEIRSRAPTAPAPTVSTGEQMRTRRCARLIALRDPPRQRLAEPGREPGTHLVPAMPHRIGLDEAAVLDDPFRPELARSRPCKSAASFGRLRRSRSRSPAATTNRRSSSSTPSRPSAPSRTAYLWCIRSGIPAIGRCGTPQRRDQLDVRLRGRRHRDRVAMADVVDHPDSDAARRRGLDRPADELCGLGPQVEVVLREVERPPSLRQKGRDLLSPRPRRC